MIELEEEKRKNTHIISFFFLLSSFFFSLSNSGYKYESARDIERIDKDRIGDVEFHPVEQLGFMGVAY